MDANVQAEFELGMIGLGTMGRNLLLNMADHGYKVIGYDKNPKQVELLDTEPGEVPGEKDLARFIAKIKTPRAIVLLVPAGKIVDAVIDELSPLLDEGDLIIDGGNSKWTDTEERVKKLEEKGLHFFGMGISGGEEGARKGPSMMPGGNKAAYEHVKNILESIAAKAKGEPCVTYIGPGASGHYVKMVHNGIEYAIMQLLAEAYELMKEGAGMSNKEIHEVLKSWNEGRLQSFLMEITADIFNYYDPESGEYLLDKILDVAKSKGTGKWTSQFAMDINLPIPSIDVAVSTRDLSKYKSLREKLESRSRVASDKKGLKAELDNFQEELEKAVYFSFVSVYAQGMFLLKTASEAYDWNLNLAEISKIWRSGCIIRSAFLEDMYQAFSAQPPIEHLFGDDEIGAKLQEDLPATRKVISTAMQFGFSLPVFASALNYYQSMHDGRMPTNLIQAQRDYFGAHTYELKGEEGTYHSKWTEAFAPSIRIS
ncbi:NADP-dependent phosphogluconate dehydrogenase [Marinilongibacter aquaticus]|uniref:NADP-dependent phosphogluconate dehydrogenase n=1 Tax=Marinilongibacter aquaticus TaxID=2975157 RepID=UPI0021BD2626|nr:NADP-dependent phosphogluconate dehydrogenase [Marinilongibacter aquaticus]UBM58353.1 NADP-dependent phosphogluconate dehydrogenase [Marinilongibacter aquaticus]